MIQKEYSVKVFDADGSTFLTSWPQSTLKTLPTFRSRLDAGLGELVLDLNVPFDDFSEGVGVDFTDIVDLYATDGDHPRGRRIYRGFISRYEPYIEDQEGVRVTCLGLASLLTRSYYGSSPTFSVAHSGEDPEAIAKAIIDNFNLTYGGSLISYSSSTAAVGTNVTYTFTDQKWFDAMKKTRELAGGGYWWKVDADGLFHFRPKPSSAAHTFTIGKDVDSFQCPKDGESVFNEIVVRRNGGTATTYTDATSQARFGTGSPATGRITKIITDTSIMDAGTANQRGQTELANAKDEKIRATISINPNYDLESIHVGETCQIANVRTDSGFFGSNMMIVGLSYESDRVRLELEQSATDLGLALEEFIS